MGKFRGLDYEYIHQLSHLSIFIHCQLHDHSAAILFSALCVFAVMKADRYH